MTPSTTALRLPALVAVLLLVSACATAPTEDTAASVGQRVTLQGEVVSVDTAPWAYDGNAVVTLSTTPATRVRVQLPARWNLCKAPPLHDVQSLKPGDRVQVSGTVTAPGELVVCGNAQDSLRRTE